MRIHLGSLEVAASTSCSKALCTFGFVRLCDEGILHSFSSFILLCCQVVPSLKSLFLEVVKRKLSALSTFLLQSILEDIFYLCISGLLKDGAYMALG